MIESKNFQEFCDNGNLVDLKAFILSKFYKQAQEYGVENLISSFAVQAIRVKMVDKYDPEKGTKFSTWMYKCLSNHIIAYFCNKTNRDKNFESCLSLDVPAYNNGSPTTFHETAQVAESFHDSDKYTILDNRRDIQLILSTKKNSTCISFLDLFNRMARGETEKDIADSLNVTIACINQRKIKMVAVLKRQFEIDHINSNCQEDLHIN